MVYTISCHVRMDKVGSIQQLDHFPLSLLNISSKSDPPHKAVVQILIKCFINGLQTSQKMTSHFLSIFEALIRGKKMIQLLYRTHFIHAHVTRNSVDHTTNI